MQIYGAPEGTRGCNRLFFFFFFFFMSLPGRQIYIFLTLIFFFLVPSRGMKCYFLTSRKLYHMKFAIFDVARCRMSATSLTFLYLSLICLSYMIILHMHWDSILQIWMQGVEKSSFNHFYTPTPCRRVASRRALAWWHDTCVHIPCRRALA